MILQDLFKEIKINKEYTNGKTIRTITRLENMESYIYSVIVHWKNNKGKIGQCYLDTFCYWIKDGR